MTIQQSTLTNQPVLDYGIVDASPSGWAGPPTYRSLTTRVAIRPALPADAPRLARLGASMFAATHRPAFKAADLATYVGETLSTQRIAAELVDPANTFLLAEIDGALGGFVKLSASPAPAYVQTPSPIELSRLYLNPRLIGRGVGSRLMTNALTQAVYKGYTTCWLYVWEGNVRAIKFYLNWSFRPVGRESFQVGLSFPVALVMSRTV